MNTAAAVGFGVVMVLGLASLTGLVYRDRRHSAPQPEAPAYVDQVIAVRFSGGDVYDETVAMIGDPRHIDLNPPAFAWPT
jgi:hypothetical protein